MDQKLAVELGVLGFSAIAVVASIYNLVVKDRPVKTGYLSCGGGVGRSGSSGQWTDPSPFPGNHSGHHCSPGGFSSDSGSCGGGDSGGGGGSS